METAVARRAAAAPQVQQVAVAAPVITSGTGLDGYQLLYSIHAPLKSVHFKQLVSAPSTSHLALARMSDKPFTQDVIKVCNE